MHVISIDIETFSDIDLGKCGVYRYAESPSFDILLFSYSMDDGQIKLIDLASGEKLPEEIINALMDESIIKTAFNANFERVCLMKYLCRVLGKEVYLDPSSFLSIFFISRLANLLDTMLMAVKMPTISSCISLFASGFICLSASFP
jgi:hypothetical protein